MEEPKAPSHLGSALRKHRKQLRLSIYETARQAGFDRAVLWRIENGDIANPDPVKISRLAEVLGVPVADLFSAAGYSSSNQLPTFQPYLRSKYGNLPPDAIERINRYFEDVRREYGVDPNGADNREDELPE